MTPLETYQAGLCTVVPTIFDECKNDRLSPNGTCFQDSCCTSFETATSWHYRLAQLSHVMFSSGGLIVVFMYTLKYSSKHMLPDNVRVLVNIMLMLIAAHSIDMVVFHTYHLFQSLRVTPLDPCFVREKVSFCAPFRYTYSFCTLTLAICQYCIYIDRLACAFYKYYTRHQKSILTAQLVQLVLFSTGVVGWIYRNEQPDTYLLSCLNVPKASTGDLTMATIVIFPINIVCFFLSILLFRHFRKKEKGSSSRFDIVHHFTAAVDVDSSEFLYRTTGTQAAFFSSFSVTSLLMRFFYNDLPRPVGLTIATLSYIFSVYCFVVPLVMIRYARRTTHIRRKRIRSHVGLKSVGVEGAENYFGMMRTQWE